MDLLGCDNVVVTVLADLVPTTLRNRLVPRDVDLLVLQTKLDLPLLEALLLAREVVNIRKRDVIGLAEVRIAIARDQTLRQLVQPFVVVTEITPIQNMVVVPSTVESDELKLEEPPNFLRLRVVHPVHMVCAGVLPADQEQVRVHLDVEIHESIVFVLRRFRNYDRALILELHLHDDLDAGLSLIGTRIGECQNPRLHVADVESKSGLDSVP